MVICNLQAHMRNALLGVLLLLCVIGALGACSESPAPGAAPGTAFPVLPLASLTGGAVLSPDVLSGKALVINFWATWCEPCRKEMPSLERLHLQADPEKLAVLGVSVDTDLHLAREFLLQHKLTFANYTDGEQKLARGALNVQAFPVTFLVAPDGTIKARINGVRDWGSADTLRMLEQALVTPIAMH